MTILFEETFGTLAAGTAITTGNTTYDLISGSGTVTAIIPAIRDSGARFVTPVTATTASARAQLGSLRGEFYARFYFRVNALPPVGTGIQIMTARSGTTARADIRLNPTGTLSLRDQGVIGGTTASDVPVAQWHRAEWHWNQTGNAQELRVWLGSNRDSAGTPDLTVTGVTAGGGTADNVNRGILTSVASVSIDFDDDRIDDSTWIGPSTPPPPTDIGDLFDVTFGSLAAATTLTTGNTGYSAITNGTAATATAIIDGVRSSGGRFAVAGTSAISVARTDIVAPKDDLYWRMYFRIAAVPTVHTTIAEIRNASSTLLADLRIMTTGLLEMRDMSGATDVSAAIPLNTWHRVEWHWNQDGLQQEVRLWFGANLHGEITQDETLATVVTSSTLATQLFRGVVSATTSWHVDLDDDKASDTIWVGPSTTSTPVGGLISEGFEGGAAAADLTTANTDLAAVIKVGTSTAKFDTDNFSSGAQSAEVITLAGGDNAQLRHDIGTLVSERWVRAYVTLDSLPGAATVIATVKESAGSTVRAQVQVHTTGQLRIRNPQPGLTVVATSNVTVQPGQMFRIEWHLSEGVEQRLRIFTGANVHGDVPDSGGEEITGPMTAGTFDRIEVGHITSGVWHTWWDDFATSDTDWVGPSGTPTTPAGTVHTGIGMPIYITPTAPPPPPGDELDALFAPPDGKVIWGATPGRLGFTDNTLANLSALETRTGRRMDAIRQFQGNCSSTTLGPGSEDRAMGVGDANGGRLLVISLKSAPFSNQQVIDGAADATLQARCNDINNYGLPVLFAWNHEPEGPGGEDMPAAQYNALQKKVLPFFRQRCPNLRTMVIFMGGANPTYLANAWPVGDVAMANAVDWIGYDPYTFRSGGSAPRPMSTIINSYMNWQEADPLRINKPVCFAEWGCADDPAGQDGAAITDAGRGKGAWFDETAAWMRDTVRGRRVKVSLYFSHPGTTPYQPVESTFTGYTASSPSRTADPVLNSLEGWKRISSKTNFPRTDVNLGF